MVAQTPLEADPRDAEPPGSDIKWRPLQRSVRILLECIPVHSKVDLHVFYVICFERLALLSIKWNSKRLGGPTHIISARGHGAQECRGLIVVYYLI